jgi:serine/threonine protein kinase
LKLQLRSDFDLIITQSNILINEMRQVLLCDFGLAKVINDEAASSGMTTTKSMRGSVRYLSPELFSEEVDLPLKNLFSDVWAWGCVLFEVFSPICY